VSTKARLQAALAELGLDALADRAAKGEFDDFSSSSPTPIGDLVTALESRAPGHAREADLLGLAARARTGAFDATKEEAQAWADAQHELQAVFGKFRPRWRRN